MARSDKLVPLYDAGRQDGTFYYAMKHLPLGTLQEPAIELSRAHAVRAVADVADAAHGLHERGIAHRDIKPDNVLLDDGGGLLSDLGLSQLLSPGLVFTGLGNIGLEYTDPAILVGGEASRASDVWSLGATLHYALTGKGVYGDLPTLEPLLLVRAILSASPTLSPELDGASAALIRACVSPNVKDRPKTAQEVAERAAALS
jgi:serine/threonine protein kinase